MPDTPRVSVVMSVYNAEKYLAEAVESMLGQTFEDFEFIVIDDGSTDGSGTILEKFAARDGRLTLLSQPNCGLVPSLNRACKYARAPYVARMDADDISLAHRLEKQVEYLDRNPEIGIVGTWIQDIGGSGEPGPIWPLPTSPLTIPWFLMFGNCMAHPTIMMRRQVIESLGYRDEAAHVEDYDLWMRASSVTRLANIPEVLLKYRVLAHSVSTRNLVSQEQQAAKLQSQFRTQLIGTDVDGTVSKDLLLKLYSAYRANYSLSRGDESEIVLDIVRRTCLSNELRNAWTSLIPLLPRLVSLQALRKMFRFGASYATNAHYGFTTQRRVQG